MNTLSIFSGCGGLDLGFHQAGFSIVAAIDNDKASLETHKANLSSEAIECDVLSDDFSDTIKSFSGIDVVLGGFPCQGFSKAGPKKAADPRNSLYKAMIFCIETLKPKIFVAENVDGLKQNYNGSIFEQICEDFSRLGYAVHCKVLNALGYGVAQNRQRIFFVGIKSQSSFNWPLYSHCFELRNGEKKYEDDKDITSNASESPKRICDVLSDLIELNAKIPNHYVKPWKDEHSLIMKHIKAGQKLCNVRFAETSVPTWDIPEVFGVINDEERLILQTIAKHRRHKKYGNIPNGNPLSCEVIENLSSISCALPLLNSLTAKGYLQLTADGKFGLKGAMFNSGLFKRPEWERPSPTVLTNFHSPRFFIHPLVDRPFSARECARLQSFPDEFVFYGKIEEQYKQIGNAVPPLLAFALAKSIREQLR